MADKKTDTASAKAPAKASVAKAATPAKAAPVKAAAKPAKTEKKIPTGATITVTQIGSPIGRPEYQRDTLKGLGLNKRHRTRTLEDTPSVRGMIESVKHLLRVG